MSGTQITPKELSGIRHDIVQDTGADTNDISLKVNQRPKTDKETEERESYLPVVSAIQRIHDSAKLHPQYATLRSPVDEDAFVKDRFARTNTLTRINAYTWHAQAHARHKLACMRELAYPHTSTHTHTHAFAHLRTHGASTTHCTYTWAHARTHTYTHTPTHTHTHTHTSTNTQTCTGSMQRMSMHTTLLRSCRWQKMQVTLTTWTKSFWRRR